MTDIDRTWFDEWRRIARVNPGYVARLPHRWEGESGEELFEERLRSLLQPSALALDVGCGGGEFTVRVAALARLVGLDPFVEMLAHACGLPQAEDVRWVRGMGEALPFAGEAFDIVYSRRGPAGDPRFLPETVRVLRPGGRFLEIAVGEQSCRELVEIFGRGQMAGVSATRAGALRRRLEERGLAVTLLREFLSRHVLIGGIAELAEALEGSPAIPSVHRRRDAAALEEAATRLKVKDGLAWTDHRVVVEAVKR